ncbi:hypothetical protein IRP16_004414 [Salmonella enterica]|nr:hypothetical protein [Salmonella enterica]EGM2364014.1 hypothetical protein [Salmonella enterica]
MKDLYAENAADNITGLLILCQQLYSNNAGATQAQKDEFSDRIAAARVHVEILRNILPMMTCMSLIGAELEHRREINIIAGESYAEKALSWMIEKYFPENTYHR